MSGMTTNNCLSSFVSSFIAFANVRNSCAVDVLHVLWNVVETRTGVAEYESMDLDVASGGSGPQRCEYCSELALLDYSWTVC